MMIVKMKGVILIYTTVCYFTGDKLHSMKRMKLRSRKPLKSIVNTDCTFKSKARDNKNTFSERNTSPQ